MSVKLLYNNILETAGTITVSPGADTSYPAYRLYDRHNGRLFKFLSSTSPSVIIGTGAADTLIIPAGHNLNGLRVKLEKNSSDSWGGTQTQLLNYLVPDSNKIVQSFTLATGWWKASITASGGLNPGIIPQFTELFLGQSVTLLRQPLKGSSFGPRYNNAVEMSEYGYPYITNYGPNVQARAWKFSAVTAAARDQLETYLALGGFKFFWVQDERGNWTWNREVSHGDFTEDGKDTSRNPLYSFDMALMEIPS